MKLLHTIKQREDGSRYLELELEGFGEVTPIAMLQDQDSGRSVLIVADDLHDSPTSPTDPTVPPDMWPEQRRIEQLIMTYRGDPSPMRVSTSRLFEAEAQSGAVRFPGPRPHFAKSMKPPKRGEKRTRPSKPHKADAPHLPKAKCRR